MKLTICDEHESDNDREFELNEHDRIIFHCDNLVIDIEKNVHGWMLIDLYKYNPQKEFSPYRLSVDDKIVDIKDK